MSQEDRIYPCDMRYDERGCCIGTEWTRSGSHAGLPDEHPHPPSCSICHGSGVQRHAWYCDCPQCEGDHGEGQWHRRGVPHYCSELEGRWWPGFGIYGAASERAGDPPAPRGDPVTQVLAR